MYKSHFMSRCNAAAEAETKTQKSYALLGDCLTIISKPKISPENIPVNNLTIKNTYKGDGMPSQRRMGNGHILIAKKISQ